MGAYSPPQAGWMYFEREDCETKREKEEEILKRLSDSFAQVQAAAEFLLMKQDPGSANPDTQLALLIKERIATLQEQVAELYRIMNRAVPPYGFSS